MKINYENSSTVLSLLDDGSYFILDEDKLDPNETCIYMVSNSAVSADSPISVYLLNEFGGCPTSLPQSTIVREVKITGITIRDIK